MSDPKHPAKIVIIIRNHTVRAIFTDKNVPATFYVANYDDGYIDGSEDRSGEMRRLEEEPCILDTAMVRNTLNKLGKHLPKE